MEAIKSIMELYDAQEKIYIERDGKKIYLTDEEIGKIEKQDYINTYIDWAIDLYMGDESISEDIEPDIVKQTIKTIAENTYKEVFEITDSLVGEQEYEIFTNEFYKAFKEV